MSTPNQQDKRHYTVDPLRKPGRKGTRAPWIPGRSPRERTDEQVLEALAGLSNVRPNGKAAILAVLGTRRMSYNEAAKMLGKQQGYISAAILSLVNRLGGPAWMYDFEAHKTTLVVEDVPDALFDELSARVRNVVAHWLAAHPGYVQPTTPLPPLPGTESD